MTSAAIGATTGAVAMAIMLTGCSQSPSSPSPLTTSVAARPSASPSGQPVAILSYQSEPGDFIGAGQSATFRLTGTQFQVTLNQTQSELKFSIPPSGGTWWNLELESAAGGLVPGYYNNATRWPFQKAGVPGLTVSGSGRSCNESTGRFLVAAAVFSGTQVQRFHARFEQHCEGWSAALRGQIWIDVSGAEPPALDEFPPSPAGPASVFSYVSGPGDYVGRGRSERLTLAGMKFLARQTPNRPGVDVILQSTQGPSIFWSASFAAASGTMLQPGTYTGATRYPFNSGVPGLSISGNGAGCNTLNGSFIVHEVSYGPSGEVLRLDVSFEQHCEGASPALRGEVLIVADPWR